MKVKDSTMAAPQTSGDMPTENIGISDDPLDQQMILNVLTNTLYTDKLAAVLREYGCNAADANVEAGKGDQPIQVRLPNKLDPTLSIRDFGHGMTQEQIVNVFCRLGRSTKRNSNAFTGMLGIGSKAGFAYGDQFMVTSFSGGTKTIYNAYRDKGIPKLAKMFEEKTSDPDGIEVKVPIRSADMGEFAEKAERVYRYFKVRPIITGAKVEWKNRELEFSGKGWRYLGGSQESVAIMGNVGYKLSGDALGVDDSSSRGTWNYKPQTDVAALLNIGVELDFDIGDLEIAANREGLQYDDLTKNFLISRLEMVKTEIGAILTGKISGAANMWDARKQWDTLFQGLGSNSTYELKRILGGNILWKGNKISSSQFNIYNPVGQTTSVIEYRRRHAKASGYIPLSSWVPVYMTASNFVAFIENDLKTISPARIRGFFEKNPRITSVIQFKFSSAKDKATYLKHNLLEGITMEKLSLITPQKIVSGTGSGIASAHRSKHSARVFEFVRNPVFGNPNNPARSEYWKPVTIDLKKDSGIYVLLDKFFISTPAGVQRPDEFAKAFSELEKAGVVKYPLYGFRAALIPKLGIKWVELGNHIDIEVNDLLQKKGENSVASYIEAANFIPIIAPDNIKLLPKKSSMRELLESQEEILKNGSKFIKLLAKPTPDTKGWLPILTLPAAVTGLSKLQGKVLQNYPMLIAMLSIGYRTNLHYADAQAIADYVKLVGK